MRIIGSSSVSQLGTYVYFIGPTGATGIIGATGPRGNGLTGGTGPKIIGITLVNRQILTTFEDGSTYLSPSKIYGATGQFQYLLDYKNNGQGVSLAYSVVGDTLYLRPIRIVPSSNTAVSINTTPSTVTIGLAPKTITGLTLTGITGVSAGAYFIKYKGNKPKRTPVTWDPASSTGVNFPFANAFQKVRGMGYSTVGGAVNCTSTGAGVTCNIDPFVTENDTVMYGSTSKVFIADFQGRTASINIAPCPAGNGIAYGFDIYIEDAKNPEDRTKRFTSTSPIKWPRNIQPCFSYYPTNRCKLKVSFFGIDGVWYATAKTLGLSCSNDQVFSTYCSNFCPSCLVMASSHVSSSDEAATGACCKTDGTCIETIPANCDGFFHGYGTTCGNTYSSICDKIGACCVSPGYGSDISNCYEMTCSECLGITGAYGRYAGNYTKCSDTNCSDVMMDIGACCDGLGHCVQSSFSECVANNGFYQGNGSQCFSGDIAVCSTGTGPCCVNGECSQNSAEACFTQNGYYLGRQRSCSDFDCPKTVSCIGYINGIPLVPGQQYGGGIVVGKYEPGNTNILGAKQWFNPASLEITAGVTMYASEYYKSYMDHTAYGITKDCGFLNESYIVIVYPRDLTTETNENTFSWGGTGSSWGPILDSGANYSDFVLRYDETDPSSSSINYWKTHLKYGEGYWSTGNTGLDQIPLVNTFPTCSSANIYGIGGVERVFAKNPYSLHGMWHQSWGLYNTIRAIHAHNAYTRKVSLGGVFTWSEFATNTGPNAFNYTRLLNDGMTSDSQGITTNSGALSGWYIPSHDELAYIAANTKDLFGFNINNQLMLTPGSQPLNGVYWSSTGSFDYFKSEGIYDGINKPSPGSVAIAMNFDVNGVNYFTTKADRQTKYKVRPIRMIRCDAVIPANRYLWLIPSVLSDINKQTNQRDIDTLSIEAI